jgi:glycosyltransferase involved in cell wall biosynthesis
MDLQSDSIFAQLDTLLNDPENLEKRREDVAEFARRHWDWETCADQYYRLFSEVIAESAKASGAAEPGPA